jgi:hypothetical protein
LPDDAIRYAQSLFSTLHLLDERGCQAIVFEPVPGDDAWRAVADRLQRASTK